MNQSLLEFAELAGLESLQYEIEGFCAYAGASGEGMLHCPYGEQHKPDHRRQGHNHQPVRPRVLQTEEVGEAHRRYTPEYKDGPEDCRDALFGCDQTPPPCVQNKGFVAGIWHEGCLAGVIGYDRLCT